MVGQGCEGVCGVCTCVRWNIWRASMLEIATVVILYSLHSPILTLSSCFTVCHVEKIHKDYAQ